MSNFSILCKSKMIIFILLLLSSTYTYSYLLKISSIYTSSSSLFRQTQLFDLFQDSSYFGIVDEHGSPVTTEPKPTHSIETEYTDIQIDKVNSIEFSSKNEINIYTTSSFQNNNVLQQQSSLHGDEYSDTGVAVSIEKKLSTKTSTEILNDSDTDLKSKLKMKVLPMIIFTSLFFAAVMMGNKFVCNHIIIPATTGATIVPSTSSASAASTIISSGWLSAV